MNPLSLVFTILLCLAILSPVSAQDGNVEINLDVLEDYTPPPMFDTAPSVQIPTVTPFPVSIVEQPKEPEIAVPLPGRKPSVPQSFLDAMEKRRLSLENSDIVIQTAQDILRQIDGDAPQATPAAPAPQQAPAEIIQPPAPSHDDFELTLSFENGVTALSGTHTQTLIGDVLVKLKQHHDAQLEIKAYAASSDALESSSRRLSLERGVNIQNFLVERGVEEGRLYVRPMGQASRGDSEFVALIFTRH